MCLTLHDCTIAGLQGCRVAGLQGCRVAGLQGCRVAGLCECFVCPATIPQKFDSRVIQLLWVERAKLML